MIATQARRRALVPALAAMTTVAACTGGSRVPCVCTAEFVFVTASVVAPSGEPATELRIRVTRVSDGLDVTPQQGIGGADRVIVLTDAQLEFVAESGTEFEAVVTGAEGTATARYVFATDPCRCHVRRVSGPTTIQLEAQGT